jgi:hypothetical protein
MQISKIRDTECEKTAIQYQVERMGNSLEIYMYVAGEQRDSYHRIIYDILVIKYISAKHVYSIKMLHLVPCLLAAFATSLVYILYAVLYIHTVVDLE